MKNLQYIQSREYAIYIHIHTYIYIYIYIYINAQTLLPLRENIRQTLIKLFINMRDCAVVQIQHRKGSSPSAPLDMPNILLAIIAEADLTAQALDGITLWGLTFTVAGAA